MPALLRSTASPTENGSEAAPSSHLRPASHTHTSPTRQPNRLRISRPKFIPHTAKPAPALHPSYHPHTRQVGPPISSAIATTARDALREPSPTPPISPPPHVPPDAQQNIQHSAARATTPYPTPPTQIPRRYPLTGTSNTHGESAQAPTLCDPPSAHKPSQIDQPSPPHARTTRGTPVACSNGRIPHGFQCPAY